MTFEEWWYDNQDKLIGEYSIALAAWDAAYLQGFADAKAELLPEGYVLVPVEPTEAMLSKGISLLGYHPAKIYKTMIQAAQEEE